MEMRTAVPINLEASLRNKLLRFSKASNVSPKLRVRFKIVLLASEGMINKELRKNKMNIYFEDLIV